MERPRISRFPIGQDGQSVAAVNAFAYDSAPGLSSLAPMSFLYPTIHNPQAPHGLPFYELRDDKLYPTVHNTLDSAGIAAFVVWNNVLVFPTIENRRCILGMAAYEIRGSQLFAFVANKADAPGLPLFDVREYESPAPAPARERVPRESKR